MRTFLSPLLLIALLALPAAARAARVGPDATLVQLDEGHGILAAEVIRATPTAPPPPGRAADEYDVTFRVRAVYAQPIVGAPFPVGPGGVIQVRLSAGYGGQVEPDLPQALAPGRRFILTVKRAGGDRYEHAPGASAAREVEAFADADRDRYARLRELSQVPVADRPARWVAVAADDANADALRSEVLAGLDSREVSRAFTPEQTAAVTAGLRALWNDPRPAFSPDLLYTLDHLLRGTDYRAFVGSADRARVWAARLLDPTPANLRDDNDRDNLALSMLRELLASRPRIVGPPSVAALADARWPEGFRRAVAAALMIAYESADAPDPSWNPALQAHYARVLASGKPWPVRLAAGDISSTALIKGRHRTFRPNLSVRSALRRALADMLAAGETDPNAPSAARDLLEALRTVEGDRPTTP